MKKKTSCLFLLMLIACVSQSHTALSQEAASNSSQLDTRTMTVTPRAEPEYALALRLETPYMAQQAGNGAPLYHLAISLLTEIMGRDSAIEDRLSQWQDKPVDALPLDVVQTTLTEFDRVFHYLELGSRKEHCHWDYPVREEGYRCALPNLAGYRTMSRALWLKARVEISQGTLSQAVDSLRIALALGRNLGQGSWAVENIVGVYLVSHAFDEIERLMQHPDAPNLYWALTALPRPLVDQRQSMQADLDSLAMELPQLRTSEQRILSNQEVIQLWDRVIEVFEEAEDYPDPWLLRTHITLAAMEAYPKARKYLQRQGMSPDAIEALPVLYVVLKHQYHQWQVLHDSIVKWYHVPYWQAQKGLNEAYVHMRETRRRRNSFDVVGKAFQGPFHIVERVHFVNTRLQRKIAILRCIEALRIYAGEHGTLPKSLQDITHVPVPRDPMFGRAFVYERIGEQAIIESPTTHSPLDDERKGIRYVITLAGSSTR